MPTTLKKPEPFRPIIQWTKGTTTHSYQVTDTDRVWLARALWREGAPRSAVGHTLLQRFASLYPRYSTLTKFLRAYCQPLSTKWFPTGYRHKRKVAKLRKAGQTKRAKAEIEAARRRTVYSRTPWEQIPIQYRQITDRLLAGRVPNPVPAAEHFCISLARPGAPHAEAKAAAEQYAQKHGFGSPVAVPGGFGRGQNWFFEAPTRRPPRLTFIAGGHPTAAYMASRMVTPTPGETAAAAALTLGLVALSKRPR